MIQTLLKIKGLKFDGARHVYTYRGKEVPSVTTVFGEWITIKVRGIAYKVNVFSGLMIRADVMQNAADTGEAIHRGCELLAQGKELNWDKLAEDLVKPLKNFLKWMEEFGFEPILTEQQIYSNEGYAGTLDLFGNLMSMKYQIDIKTGLPSWTVGMQTAAYQIPLEEMLLKKGLLNKTDEMRRGVLYLPKKGGKCKLKLLDNPDDYPMFKRFLKTYNYRKELMK